MKKRTDSNAGLVVLLGAMLLPTIAAWSQDAIPPVPPPIQRNYEFIEVIDIGGSPDTQNALVSRQLRSVYISSDNKLILFCDQKSLRAAALWSRELGAFIEFTHLSEAEILYHRRKPSGNVAHEKRSKLLMPTTLDFDILTNQGFLVAGGQYGESRRLVDFDGNTLRQSPAFSYGVFEAPVSSSESSYFLKDMQSSDSPTYLMSFDDFETISIPQPGGFKDRVFRNAVFRVAFTFEDGIRVYSPVKSGDWSNSHFSFPHNWEFNLLSARFVNEDQWLALHVVGRFGQESAIQFLDCSKAVPTQLSQNAIRFEDKQVPSNRSSIWVNRQGTRLAIRLSEHSSSLPIFYDLIDGKFQKVADVNSHKELTTVFRRTDFGLSPDGSLVGFHDCQVPI